jgi:hypothetical protein
MKVFVSSSWKNAQLVRALANRLRERGHQVFDFTDPESGVEGLGGYIFDYAELAKIAESSEINWLAALNWNATKKAFVRDKAGLDWSDTAVMILPCGRSAHMEAGYAVGQGKRLFIIGDLPEGEFEVLYKLANGCFLSHELHLLYAAIEAESGPVR